MNEQIEYYQNKLAYEIDSWDLYESLAQGKNVIVIDARSVDAFNEAHIPTAINIPHRTINEASTSHLDKQALYVSYCDGIGCNASTKGALNLAKLGFTVKELLGGLDWWHRDGYASEGKNARPSEKTICGC